MTAFAIRSPSDVDEPRAYFDDTSVQFRYFDRPPPKPLVERKLRSAWRSGWELSVSTFGDAVRRESAGDYDVILAEQIGAARIVEGFPRVVCSLLCLRHVDVDAIAGQGGRFRRWQLRREELTTLSRVTLVRTLTRRLERLVNEALPAARTCVVPLCLDPHLYEPVPPPAEPTVGVIGSMHWEPSRAAAETFVRRIVPRVRDARPSTKFLVAGWKAATYLGALAREAGVEVVEDVVDPRDMFRRLSVLVYTPRVGTGMKVKVLEAMAFGVPAVVNAEGYEGLEAEPDTGVNLAGSEDEVVDATIELLSDSARRARSIRAARSCLERAFAPEVVADALVAEAFGRL